MSDNLKVTSSVTQTLAQASEGRLSADLSAQALARRKMLIKSLCQGSVVVAAATVPMHSLAVIATKEVTYDGTTYKATRCGVSGLTSGIHSKETLELRCTGASPVWYKKNPGSWPSSATTITLCKDVFTKSTLKTAVYTKNSDGTKVRCDPLNPPSPSSDYTYFNTVNSTLLQVLKFHPNTDECHWITAWLNAQSSNLKVSNFPYTSTEVVGLYNGSTSDQALSFFKIYMETEIT